MRALFALIILSPMVWFFGRTAVAQEAPAAVSQGASRGLLVLAVIALAVAFLIVLRANGRAAARVQAVRDELETVFNAATSGVVALAADGQIIRLNSRARHMLGGLSAPTPFQWPEAIAFLDSESLKPLDNSADPVRRALAGHELRHETQLMRRTQEGEPERYVRIDSAQVQGNANGIAVVLVLDDVSNEERNRQVVERSNRLDALGQLTGGIAHDFNNLLASQLYAIDLARNATDADKRATYLEAADLSIRRGRALTARLLAFARRQPGLATVRLTSEVFADFLALVRPMLEAHIEVTTHVEDPQMRHFCDQAQLETAMMNLVLNSRDAILRSGKGNRIEIKARAVRSSSDRRDPMAVSEDIADSSGASFRFVEISVSDNGPGMDPETLARAADPFFTTKDSNSGTGLGLAMVYGFIRQSQGDFRIYSEEGLGTTVQLTLPRGTETGEREDPVPLDEPARGAGERILVVEDELPLLVVMTDVLEQLGYEVLAAQSGQEALSMAESGEAFDLLLTDVVMPGLIGGFELARRVRRLRGDVAVIYTSGYTGFTASEMGEVQAQMLQKPSPPNELAAAVKRALVERAAEP